MPMLTAQEVPLSRSALLVVDARESFKATPRWERRSNRGFERQVAARVDGHRGAGLPVLYFLHTDGDPGFATDSAWFRLVALLAPRADEPVVVKSTRTCFTSTSLGGEASEERTIRALRRRLARIVRTEALVAELAALPRAESPAAEPALA